MLSVHYKIQYYYLLLLIFASFIGPFIGYYYAITNNPQEHTIQLECVDKIIKHVSNTSNFDPIVSDLITFAARYGLRQNVRDEYNRIYRRTKLPFDNSKTLKKRIQTYSTCQKKKSQFKVGICSIQNYNALYVQEWLSHYLLLGVNKVYIYDNNNEEDISQDAEKIMKPFKDIKFVETFAQKGNYDQPGAYRACVQSAKKDKIDYLGFFDIDEFFLLGNKDECIGDLVKRIEDKADPNYPVGDIAVWLRNMAPHGAPEYSSTKTVFEQMTIQSSNNLYYYDLKKHIVKTIAFDHFPDPHWMYLGNGYYGYDLKGDKLEVASHHIFYNLSLKSYEHGELRHFWGQTLDFMFFNKLCGIGKERQGRQEVRIENGLADYRKDAARVVAPLPKNHFEFRKFLYNEEE